MLDCHDPEMRCAVPSLLTLDTSRRVLFAHMWRTCISHAVTMSGYVSASEAVVMLDIVVVAPVAEVPSSLVYSVIVSAASNAPYKISTTIVFVPAVHDTTFPTDIDVNPKTYLPAVKTVALPDVKYVDRLAVVARPPV